MRHVRGADIATLVSRCVELLIVIYYLKFKEHKLNLSLRKLVHIDTSYVQDYMHVSLPVLINQALWGIAQMVQTGDINRYLPAIVLILSGVGMAGICLLRRKKKKD